MLSLPLLAFGFAGVPPAPQPTPRMAEWLAAMPEHMVLHAPFTPFTTSLALNATEHVVGRLARQAKALGVTVVFVGGGMGQFDTMTVQERKDLATAWGKEGAAQGLYVIFQVGQTVQAESIELAQHAASVAGVHAIAAVPPYYERQTTVEPIVAWLQPIAAAAPKLPLFYYHIPSSTGATIKVGDLFRAAETALPNLAGVKFVSSDLADWLDIVQTYNASRALMFAPEPKLASFALGLGRGTVLAEDFFAPTYLRMHAAYVTNGSSAAATSTMQAEQAFKMKASAVFGKYGGGAAERAVYARTCAKVDLGPPRPPKQPMAAAEWPALEKDLEAVGFWKQAQVVC